ncbi:MAG TPA: FAD-dependent oxidoreductase [Syntrophorhabdaceae bacterium]|nr:FAD-dependent oxidoreductase [Syntrophorhabdaceae bacterium]
MNENYDVVIIGAGPAGLTAGIYTSRNRLRTLLLDRETIGGKLPDREKIENYPSYPEGISGADLGTRMFEHATAYGADLEFDTATSIAIERDRRIVRTLQEEYAVKAVIIAGGARNKKLHVPGEEEFSGRGVFYCATCDGPGFANQVVAVAGSGDSGLTEALYLAGYVKKVIVIEAMDRSGATKLLQERAFAHPKIEIRLSTRIEAILGDDRVRSLWLVDAHTARRTQVVVDGLLVWIGMEPNTDYLKATVELDKAGSVLVNYKMGTRIPGVFAAGDIRHQSAMQVAAAVGDGATAAIEACKYITECNWC